MGKSVIYMLQENVGHTTLTNLEEAQHWSDDPKNKHLGLSFNAILQSADEENQNKRIYTKKAITEGMARQERLMKQGHLWMESGHPLTQDPRRFSTILMENSAAVINNVNWNGILLEGKITTLQNRVGKDLKGILLQGISPGISLRGMGSVTKRNGKSLVESNLRIITYDVVLNPSHKQALTSKIITESEVSDMIMHSSENIQLLNESLIEETGHEINLINSKNTVYNLAENTAVICTDGQCMKVFLEDHIKELYKYSFGDSLGV